MTDAYDLRVWHDFATGLATASAALTGLVFVAVSIHLDAVLADPLHRRRAASTFISLLVVAGAALSMLAPGITREVFGSLALALSLALLARAARSAVVLRGSNAGREPWLMWGVAIIAYALLLAGGVGLLTRELGGVYLVAVALVLTAARAMWIVWVLFVSISEEDVDDELPADVRLDAGHAGITADAAPRRG
jgi:modulator of FtsH protease